MKNRILKIRKENKMTQDAFAEKLGLSKNFVWMLEKGERVPSDRTISDICREFNVREAWLRTGEGEPTIKLTRNQEISKFSNDIMELPDDDIKKRLILAISKLTANDWNRLIEIAEDVLQTQNRQEDNKATD